MRKYIQIKLNAEIHGRKSFQLSPVNRVLYRELFVYTTAQQWALLIVMSLPPRFRTGQIAYGGFVNKANCMESTLLKVQNRDVKIKRRIICVVF